MTAQPDPQLVREIVRDAIGYVTRDSVRCRLVQAAMAEHGIDEHDLPAWSAYYDAALEALDAAKATGVWQDERDADVTSVRDALIALHVLRINLPAPAARRVAELDAQFTMRIAELNARTADGGVS